MCCHMPGISQSVSNTSLTPPLQCLSPFLARFSIGKRNGLPKMNGDWNPPSFTYPSVPPSIHHPKVFSPPLSFSAFLPNHTSTIIHSQQTAAAAAAGGLMPDMSCERAENSLSQNTRGIQRFFSQNGGIDLRDMLTHDGRNFSGARLR